MKRKPDTAPKFPALRKKCKYCKLEFTTPATANGQKMEFCKPTHRWAYAREGSKPIDAIMRKYEKRMREIAREEADARYERLKVYVMDTLNSALGEIHPKAAALEELEKAMRIHKRLTGEGPIGREAAQALVDSFSPCR